MAEKVLIVDDVNMFLELEKGFLQRSSVKILTARDGKQALDICQAEQPALVFMDLHMPVMDGAECCRAIKRDPQLKLTSVVLITSEGKDVDRQTCLEARCDDFLTKPLDRQLFLATARRHLPDIDRREQRLRCNINAKFRAFGITLAGSITDISQKGVYLAAECQLNKGTEIDLIFALPDPIGSIVQAQGRVAWINTRKTRLKPSLPEGFGLELVNVSEEGSREIARFLASAELTSPVWKAS